MTLRLRLRERRRSVRLTGRAAGRALAVGCLPGVAGTSRPQGRRLLHLRGRAVPRRRGPHRRRAGRHDRVDRAARRRRQGHHVGGQRRQGARRRPRSHHVAQPGVGPVRSARSRLHRRPGDGRRRQIGLDTTAVPVEWDEVKEQLTELASSSARRPDSCRVRWAGVNQAADTFDGNGDSFRNALRELSQTAGRLGDSRTDMFGTVRNLQVLVNALSNSNEQIVQFSGHVASVSQVLADSSTDLDKTLGTLNQALSTSRASSPEQLGADRDGRQAHRLHPDADRSQRRHRADTAHRPPGWRTSTTSTTPRRARWAACCRCRTSPTPSSSSAAARSNRGGPSGRTTTSGPRSAASGWARRCAGSR